MSTFRTRGARPSDCAGKSDTCGLYGGTETLPYYLRYFLGGENQIRGFDLRTVGPINEDNQLIGGNKFVLFNAEYYLDIHPQRAGARVPRCRAGLRRDAAHQPPRAAHLERPRTARRDAGLQHAVPTDLLVEQVSRHFSTGPRLPLLCRHDVLAHHK